ncbi:MAG: DUF1697 domain-containing protein [Pseudomonadota bacterium]|nr:DUF1697 domain-containing protein [Pseudomonadota bacterium]
MVQLAAFLRAVNVGGTGKMPMTELKAMCEGLGFVKVKTYIASGNVVFETSLSAAKAKAALEASVVRYLGKPVGLFMRDKATLEAMIGSNPFAKAEGHRVMVILLDATPSKTTIDGARFKVDEEIAIGHQCLYVHYPSGMGKSKLKISGAEQGTARYMNTMRAMLEMLS